jgi:hypothetical protein
LNRIPAKPYPLGIPNTYKIGNIVNPAEAGTYYVRVYIFSTVDASGPATEDGGIAIAITGGLSVSAVVPPYLKFCSGVTVKHNDCSTATDHLLNLGNFTTAKASAGSSQFLVATNAGNGYTISVHGTTLTSGNNTIKPLASPKSSVPGNSQFGMNLMANASPEVGADPTSTGSGKIANGYGLPNFFMYNDGDVVVSSGTVSENQTFTASYLVNISKDDPPGLYATTLTYICLANF